MSLKYIRDYYRVPAKRGEKVAVKTQLGKLKGIIVGSKNSYLRIKFPDLPKQPILTYHPTYNIEYNPEDK